MHEVVVLVMTLDMALDAKIVTVIQRTKTSKVSNIIPYHLRYVGSFQLGSYNDCFFYCVICFRGGAVSGKNRNTHNLPLTEMTVNRNY